MRDFLGKGCLFQAPDVRVSTSLLSGQAAFYRCFLNCYCNEKIPQRFFPLEDFPALPAAVLMVFDGCQASAGFSAASAFPAFAASSAATAFIDSLIRPRSSVSRTLTRTS